tara:strand:- start:925 stop:3423 length:2499 start_codon:yes stop_codon:yes gene_type:complete
MPKNILDIKAFHGGLNNSADPRDITDIELAEAVNIDVSSVGKIVMLGGQNNYHPANTSTNPPDVGGSFFTGFGLFGWSSDYQMIGTDGTIAANTQEQRTNFFALYEQEDDAKINIFQKRAAANDGQWTVDASKIALGGTSAKPSFYVANGNLRISDYSNATANKSKYFGIATPKTYGIDTTDFGLNYVGGCERTGHEDFPSTVSQDAKLEGCFPITTNADGDIIASNAIVGNVFDNDTGTNPFASVYGFANEETDSSTPGFAASGMLWGLALETDEGADNTGTWMPNETTRYKFYVTTVYDDGTQESLPQLMKMYMSNMYAVTENLSGDPARSEIWFQNANSFADYGTDVAVNMIPVIKIVGSEWNSTSNQDSFVFGASSANATSGGDKRISGCRIYWSENEDGYSDLWRLFDIDFHKGVKAYGMDGPAGGDGYSPWIGHSQLTGTNIEGYQYLKPDFTGSNLIEHPPRLLSYYAHNTHEHTDAIMLNSYRSAVVVNGIVYAGNVNQTIDGMPTQFSDRIMRSVPFQYDKFPQSNYIETAANDGDEIIALAAYNDRLLQFNSQVLYIHNIAQGDPYLEGTFKFKGVNGDGVVCTTDNGIAWANNEGAYFYNGSQIIDLIERDGQKVIDPQIWKDFWDLGGGDKITVGYIPNKKQILFQSYGRVYIYTLTTQSWIRGSADSIFSYQSITNFINDYNGDLIYYNYHDKKVKTWDITPDTANANDGDNEYEMNITTKDIDFGSPNIRKRVYKVYITYKGDTNFPAVTYGVDGGALDSTTTAVTAMSDNTEWARAEYKMGSDANNCYSFQLKLSGATDSSFEINDISIIYRVKSVK